MAISPGAISISNLTIWFPGNPLPILPTPITPLALAYSHKTTHTHRTTTVRVKPKPTRVYITKAHSTTHHTKKPTKSHKTKRPTKHPSKKPTTPRHTKRPTKTTHHTTTKRPKPTKTTKHPPTSTTAKPAGNGAASTTTPSSDVYNLELTWDDATWLFINSILIFTMQSGFGLLESGCVQIKNETNIMMKNVVDIVLGGLTYWAFGFSLTFGQDPGSNAFAGVGEYAVDSNYDTLGPVFTQFFFQLSFATTATTIVSGTMAERCNFKAYCIFSLLNTVVYCVPARWVWGSGGFLSELGCIDIAGSGAVHLLGGTSGYIAAWMLGPRMGRYDNGTDPLPIRNPTNCIIGMFILWWGWLAFNAGSTFGVSGDLWKFAARAAVTTMIAPFGGALIGSIYTLSKAGGFFDVMDIVNTILGALVGVTAGCALYHTFDALVVGIIGGIVVIVTSGFADFTRVDDPVGATPVHAFSGIWGLIAVGLFADDDQGAGFSKGNAGVFRGGTFYLLLIQMLTAVCIIAWAVITTFILLWCINIVVPIRLETHEELLGADFTEHLMRRKNAGITPLLSALGPHPHIEDIKKNSVTVASTNPVHDTILHALNEINGKKRWKAKGKVFSRFTPSILPSPVVSVDLSSHRYEPNEVENGNGTFIEPIKEGGTQRVKIDVEDDNDKGPEDEDKERDFSEVMEASNTNNDFGSRVDIPGLVKKKRFWDFLSCK